MAKIDNGKIINRRFILVIESVPSHPGGPDIEQRLASLLKSCYRNYGFRNVGLSEVNLTDSRPRQR